MTVDDALFDVTPLYLPTLECKDPVIVHQGGTSSSKTYTILQVLFTKAITQPDVVCTIVGQDIPNMKKGVIRDALKIFRGSPTLQKFVTDYNITDRTFFFRNGSVMEFTSFEDEQDARSGKRQYLYMNEANGMAWDLYWTLKKRTYIQTFLDYNPTAVFWVHEKLIGTPGVALFVSYHKHNTFLPQSVHDDIEGIEEDELWKVYARGKTGTLKGLAYPNWKMVDEFPENLEKFIYGIDFGYTSDQTGVVKIGVRGRDLYVKELVYLTGIGSEVIADILKKNGYNKEIVYCEHDRTMVSELRSYGIRAVLCLKGPGCEKRRILKVRSMTVFITSDSVHIWKERSMYRFMYIGDTATNTMEKSPDHLLDALGYAVDTHFRRPGFLKDYKEDPDEESDS
jgi:phage terminase large subunit